MAWMTGLSSVPLQVSEYSTVGGMVANAFRSMMPLSLNVLSSLTSILC